MSPCGSMHEGRVDNSPRGNFLADVVTDPEPQHVAVKPYCVIDIGGLDDDVAEPQLPRDEAAFQCRGVKVPSTDGPQ